MNDRPDSSSKALNNYCGSYIKRGVLVRPRQPRGVEDSTATATLSTIYSRLGLPFDTLRYKIIFRATNTCRGFIKSSFLYKGEEQS